MYKTMFATLVVLFIAFSATAQLEYSILSISPEMKENANAVIRKQSRKITIEDIDRMKVESELHVTVLNEAGNRHALAVEFYDKTIRIKDQEMVIYNSLGKQIEKFRRSDFQDRSYNDGNLFTDNRIKYANYTPTTYPYTMVYKSVTETSETVFVYPWEPIRGYYLSVEESSYKLQNPAGIPIRYKEMNFEGYDIEDNSTNLTLSYRLSNAQALEMERLSPDTEHITPRVIAALSRFSLGDVPGSANDWKSFGKWQYDHLVAGLDEIPEATEAHISSLVQGVTSPKEKAKIIYEYVQDKTRYISIQLGIGGWRPFPAAEVDALGYGDCKGLTNYTKALLKTQGIESYYTVVYAGDEKKSIDHEFTSMQGNHVILNVPFEDEEVWLECTSQTIPFNFLGDFTDDRDVLVLTPEGGVIKHTPDYSSTMNSLKTTGVCDLTETGDIKVDVTLESQGIQYDQRYSTQFKKEKEKESYYKNYWSYIDNISLQSISIENNRNDIVLTEDVTFSARNYSNFAGNDMLVPINILNRMEYIPKRYKNRKQPFELLRGFLDTDEVVVNLPDNYIVSFIPEKIEVESEFGMYTTEVEKINERQLKFKRTLMMNNGTFPKESYSDYRDFCKKVSKSDNQKIILQKQ